MRGTTVQVNLCCIFDTCMPLNLYGCPISLRIIPIKLKNMHVIIINIYVCSCFLIFICTDLCYLFKRVFDHSMEGFKNWEFMTTHCWGEKAAGDWILEIYDTPSQLRNVKTPGMYPFFY